jgi:hypothetical protein
MRAGIFGSARVASGGGGFTYGFQQEAVDIANLTAYTFATQPIGSAAADRVIVVAIGGRAGANNTVTGVTVGGIAATEAIQTVVSGNTSALYYAAVPSGVTADVVATFSAGMVRAGIALWRLTGFGSVSATSVGTGSTITGDATGIMIATVTGTGASTYTWSDATEQFDVTIEGSGVTFSGAQSAAAGTVSLTVSSSATANSLVAATFSP